MIKPKMMDKKLHSSNCSWLMLVMGILANWIFAVVQIYIQSSLVKEKHYSATHFDKHD